jgi:Ser/Thr protein kinase RdoA (MazF antagonist)
MTSSTALHAVAARLLGPCTVTGVLSPAVARITTESGDELVVKQHATRSKHEREVHAYRRWAGALGSSAPALKAVDDPAMVIITSALPGRVHSGDLPASAHRQAGAVLRRFHDAEPPSELPWFHDWLHDRADHWSGQAATLLSAADAAVIGSHLAALAEAKVPPGGPCHLDFQPRNWLISRSGDVSLIDFEHARINLPARDFVRLRFRIWAARPDLRDAFLDGYGRPLTEDEDQPVWHLGAIDALTVLVRGHETGDPELTASGRATLQQLQEQP